MWTLAHIQFACIRAIAHTSLYVRSSSWLSPTTQPDRFKNYPCRPNLYACRIFLPKNPLGKKTLPLVIRAHGGGFIVNYPAADDVLARRLADQANCIVVSIDYSKSPQSKFPAAYEDVIAQSLAVIDDQELPIDKSKVVLCGSSAGGNLLLGACQDSRLRSKVLGVVSIYPAVDFTSNGGAKMATRPDPSVPDFIGQKSYNSIQSLYFDEAQTPSMDDVRVSPTFFATRKSLPLEVFLIGAEHDMFCREVEIMANKLAGDKTKVLSKEGWRAPGVQYYKVFGQPHAFEGFPVKDIEAEKARVAATDNMINSISEWLIDTFSKAGSD
jgi:acetyl esterase/lipase